MSVGNITKIIVTIVCLLSLGTPCLATDATEPLSAVTEQAFSSKYTELTKEILLSGINIERFSLNYRLEQGHVSKLQKLVFFGTQQAGSAGGLAFEIVGNRQFGRGRHDPASINKSALRNGLAAAEVGAIIAVAGCGFELVANTVKFLQSRKRGLDTKSANRYLYSQLQKIDRLVAQREALVAANPEQPGHDRYVVEGKILQYMRGAFVNEYAHFSANKRSALAAENLFYLLSGAYNTVGAVGAGLGYRAVNAPKFNGSSNMLFAVSGAIATAAPLLCSAEIRVQRRLILHSLQNKWGEDESHLAEISKQLALLESLSNKPESPTPFRPPMQSLAIYTQSSDRFAKQLENEATAIRNWNKVALQNAIIGPSIGSLLMTQGILGTHGYYQYFPRQPRKQLDLNYKGSVCGTIGTGIAVVGNVAWFLGSMSYEHHLKKGKRLPEQLIKERLDHLNEIEKVVARL